MRVSHNFSAEFDDDNLIATGGLVPVMLLAQSAGLSDLVDEHVTVAGANAEVKVAALVAGMVAGADSISDMDLLRHGGMGRAFTEHRAPTTLGTHLRGYRFGHVRQLDAIASRLLAALSARIPGLLRGGDEMAYLDIDDTICQTYGYAKQGAGYGYNRVKGLNALVARISTPLAAPVIAAMRLRKGSVKSPRGAKRMIAEAMATARRAGVSGKVTGRADSAFYQHDVIAALRRAKAHFSITARMDAGVVAAISRIPERKWVGIKYSEAIWDEDEHRWLSDAEVAEIPPPSPPDRRPSTSPPGSSCAGSSDSIPSLCPRARARCSASTVITRCSQTHRCRCWRPRPLTGTTPSSSRSSPT